MPGPVWTSIAAVWLTRKGSRPPAQLTQLSIREDYVLRDINCLLRVGYWQSQCTVFRPVFQPVQPPARDEAAPEPAETAPQPATNAPTAAPVIRQQSIEPDMKPEYVDDDSDSDDEEADRTSYHGIDFSEDGVSKILAAAAATADKKSLIIYDNEKKFLQGAEQVILVFPPPNGLPWHIGVCHRPSQKTRLFCPVREADSEAMLAHIKERFLAFPSLRCDMSDLAAVNPPRRTGKVPLGGWIAIIAVWLSRGNSADKLAEPRIRKKFIRRDMNLILAGEQWADKCFRTGRKERSRALEKVKEMVKEKVKEEVKGAKAECRGSKATQKRKERRRKQAELRQAADSEERHLNVEPEPSAPMPVFRTHATQPITIHI